MKNNAYLKLIVILGSVVLTSTANAAFPNGLWQVDQYDFITDQKINTMLTCIASDGTFSQGASMQSIDWHGKWKMNGRQVLLQANNINGSSVSAYFLTKSNSKTMTGYNESWDLLNSSISFYTTGVWMFKDSNC